MDEKLVTVVVPIYNVEKYLNNCIESIVNQTYRNLEILLIDDGSPDSCPRICDEWAKRDSRIQVIHKENQGLGMARNTGIEHAAGEYICFFDSDDYVDLRTIEKAYQKAEQHKADIVIFGFNDFDDTGKIIAEWIPKVEKTLFAGSEVRDKFLPDLIDSSHRDSKNKSILLSACVVLFSMKLIRKAKWRFVSEREIISEDSYSIIKLYEFVDSVYVLCEPLYYYRNNHKSLSRSFRKDRFLKTKAFAEKTVEAANECGYSDKVTERICGLFFGFTIDAMKQIVLSNEEVKDKIKRIREVVCDPFLHECLKKYRCNAANMPKWLLHKVMLCKLTLLTYIFVCMKVKNG